MSDIHTNVRNRFSPATLPLLILLAIFGIALAVRVFPPYDNVFTGDWVRFAGNDPWYHMRLVENLLHHFPHAINFDPYTNYPYGQPVFFAPFFDLLLGFIVWIIGLGSPSQQVIETVGAYFPAVLGALVTVPVYLIGRELFNKTAGLFAAALVAILPGEFLTRSLLGFTDHHVLEALLSTLTVLLLILAIKSARARQTSLGHLIRRQWSHVARPVIFAVLAGVVLGIYLLSWSGGAFFVFILFCSAVVLYIADHVAGRSTGYLTLLGVPLFAAALAVTGPFLHGIAFNDLTQASLIISLVAFPVMGGLSWLMQRWKLRRAYYPLALVAFGLAGAGLFYAIDPALLTSGIQIFEVFKPVTSTSTIYEAQPLFSSIEGAPFARGWDRFTTTLFIAPVALVLLAYSGVRRPTPERTLFLVWTLLLLAAMLAQVRFTYYFAINAALLSGYLCSRLPEFVSSTLARLGFSERPEGSKAAETLSAKRRKRKERSQQAPAGATRYLRPKYVSAALAAIAVFFLAFYPNIGPSLANGSLPRGPSDDWHSALLWMRDNTPDPFQDPNFFYAIYQRPTHWTTYDYPESAYAVMSWWDYGHWITAIAHRIANANPHQSGAPSAARFLVAQDEASANEVLDKLGSKNVIIDFDTALPYQVHEGKTYTGNFYAVAEWAGKSPSDFYDVYQLRVGGELRPKVLLYPEYYRAVSTRLYNFGGMEVIPANSTYVISYTQSNGYKEVTSSRLFPTFEEAEEYLESQTSPNFRIVGQDPFLSPVPLEKMESYRLIHHSDSPVATREGEVLAYTVQVYEYTPVEEQT